MKLVTNLTIIKMDEHGKAVEEREPTVEELAKFLQMFADMKDIAQGDAEGELWFVDEDGKESFEFDNLTADESQPIDSA